MSDVRLELDDGVALVTLDRPEQRNAFSGAMGEALSEAYRRCDADDAVRALRDQRPEKSLTPEETARRRWAERLAAHLPLANELVSLVDATVLTETEAEAVMEALKNRKPKTELSKAEQAEREWVGRLKSHLKPAKSFGKFVEVKITVRPRRSAAWIATGEFPISNPSILRAFLSPTRRALCRWARRRASSTRVVARTSRAPR